MRILLSGGAARVREVDDLAALYAFPNDRTWVRAVFVSSTDGTAQAADGTSGPLSTPGDRRVFELQRSLCDVVLVGANTARAEGYHPVGAHEVDADERRRHGLSGIPPIAVVTRSLAVVPELLDPAAAAPTIVVTTQEGADRAGGIGDHVRIVVAGGSEVDLSVAVARLAELGLHRVLCEGGPTLHAHLVAAGLLDELCLTYAPYLVAGDGSRITNGPFVEPTAHLHLAHLLEEDGTLFARYLVDSPEPSAPSTSARS